jgi:hypothetical protein
MKKETKNERKKDPKEYVLISGIPHYNDKTMGESYDTCLYKTKRKSLYTCFTKCERELTWQRYLHVSNQTQHPASSHVSNEASTQIRSYDNVLDCDSPHEG